MNDFEYDEWGQFVLTKENIEKLHIAIREQGAVALPVSLGNGTLFHMSFVNLGAAIPFMATYSDGSNRGLQINIDRKASYSLPWGSRQEETSYMQVKWNLLPGDAEALLPLFNGVLSGQVDVGEPA